MEKILQIGFGLLLGFWLMWISVSFATENYYDINHCGNYAQTPISQVPAVCYFAYGLDI